MRKRLKHLPLLADRQISRHQHSRIIEVVLNDTPSLLARWYGWICQFSLKALTPRYPKVGRFVTREDIHITPQLPRIMYLANKRDSEAQ